MVTQQPAESKWYALHTYSGHERKVKQQYEHLATLEGLRPYLTRIVVPEIPEIQVKNGKKKQVMKNFMPGYLLVQMEDVKDLFAIAGKISGVTGFVPDSNHPMPMPNHEVERLLQKIDGTEVKPQTEIKFEPGDSVKVNGGPFSNFHGVVSEVDREKGKLKVMISIFGRSTAVELDVGQVEAV
jgi:transcriptional antiterminator NusG